MNTESTEPQEEGSQDLAKRRRVVHRADIKQYGDKILIPEGMTFEVCIDLLVKRKEHLDQVCELTRDYDAFPWDGAAAVQRVLKDKYGWVPAKNKEIVGMFGTTVVPPQTIAVETAYGVSEQVPWGQFELPGISGHIETMMTQKNGRFIFQIEASIKRVHETEVQELFNAVQQELTLNSIYRGKAIRISFNRDDGEPRQIPLVQFIPTNIKKEDLIFSQDLADTIDTNLFTPIERLVDCLANDIPVKRGVLLGGSFGVGKTLAAAVAANLATTNDITYLYVPKADELKEALAFARQYQSPACVVFCEDVDRVTSGERSAVMDELLNIIDGIDGKNSNIVVVLTTNYLEKINQALLRPGRLDAVIDVVAPNAEASERLIRLYGGESISAEEDLTEVGSELSGKIPAVHQEVVKRAKLAELKRSPAGIIIRGISSQSLLESAKTMSNQLALLAPIEEAITPTLDTSLGTLVARAVSGEFNHKENEQKLQRAVN